MIPFLKIIDGGEETTNMFEYVITRPMGWIIQQIYDLVANYGLAIILFTVIIKMILLPLNVKSQKAMKKQQKIQPLIQELQTKYANDKEKLQREMAKIYKENNISMSGGCLPLLIQFPILIGLYRVIQRPLSYLMNVDFSLPEVLEKVTALRDAMAASIGNLASQAPETLAKTSQIQISKWAQMVNGASDPWVVNFNFCGLDLSNTPSAAFTKIMALDFSDISIIMLLIIPAIAVGMSVLQNRITMQQSGQTNRGDDSAAQMSKSMTMMMPVMTAFFTLTLPSGLGIYWIISSLVQILQQLALNYYLNKKGDEVVVRVPERKQLHGKNSKKRR